MVVLQVVLAFERGVRVQAHEAAVPFAEEALLPEDLNGAVARAVDADLRARQQAVTELEADLRPSIDAEAVRDEVAEITLAERPREAMGDPEREPVFGHPQRGRQADEREIGLEDIDRLVGISPRPGRLGGRSLRLCLRTVSRVRRLLSAGGGRHDAQTEEEDGGATAHHNGRGHSGPGGKGYAAGADAKPPFSGAPVTPDERSYPRRK